MKSGRRIIHYDFNDLNYAGFYLSGLLENAPESHYELVISRAVPDILRDPTMEGPWRALLFSVCLFKATLEDEEFYFCIDTRDSAEADPSRGMGYHLPLLRRVKYYFKVNYNEAAVLRDPDLRAYASKIIPAPPCFGLRCRPRSRFLPRITPCRVTGWRRRDAVKRARDMLRQLGLEEVRCLRSSKKKFDLFFFMMFYNDPAHAPHNEFRYRVMKEIRKHCPDSSVTAFASRGNLPGKFAEFQASPCSPRVHARALASSRLAVYVRGLYDCVSFKLPQYLALGLPVVGQTIANNQEMLYENPYFREQFAYNDPERIVREAMELLARPERLRMLARSNARVFDSTFTPRAAVADILSTVLGHAKERRASREVAIAAGPALA